MSSKKTDFETYIVWKKGKNMQWCTADKLTDILVSKKLSENPVVTPCAYNRYWIFVFETPKTNLKGFDSDQPAQLA